MKIFFLMALSLFISASTFAASPKSMICHDTEFGAVHFKLIISDVKGFFDPRDQKSPVKGAFWIKGDAYVGMLESAAFMPEWGVNTGWYRSSPSPLEYSLCNWKTCPIRKIKLQVHTKDQLKAEGRVKFIHQTSKEVKNIYDRRLNCELK